MRNDLSWSRSSEIPRNAFEYQFKYAWIMLFCYSELIRELILFGKIYPNFGIWSRNFQNEMIDLKSAPSK